MFLQEGVDAGGQGQEQAQEANVQAAVHLYSAVHCHQLTASSSWYNYTMGTNMQAQDTNLLGPAI